MAEPILKDEDLKDFQYGFQQPTLAGLIHRIRTHAVMKGWGKDKVPEQTQAPARTEDDWKKNWEVMTSLGYKMSDQGTNWEWAGEGQPPENLPATLGTWAGLNIDEIKERSGRKSRIDQMFEEMEASRAPNRQ